jgi:hypothetical protein
LSFCRELDISKGTLGSASEWSTERGGRRREEEEGRDLADCLEESVVIDREGLGFVDDTLRLESHLHVRVLLIQRRMALEAVKMKSSLVDA